MIAQNKKNLAFRWFLYFTLVFFKSLRMSDLIFISCSLESLHPTGYLMIIRRYFSFPIRLMKLRIGILMIWRGFLMIRIYHLPFRICT
ncbi:hypothetical protein ACFP3I_05960 [Chryseobacterium arachidis]|uniref:hypothetical protein n=1 Tax=Chryseobacterium arachidis TaxID=1416778 RepID=UPI00361551BE